MGSRFIKVDKPLAPRAAKKTKVDSEDVIRPPGCKTIFIKNLPYDCTELELQDIFKIYGKISNIRLAKWGHTNQQKGFGYIDFNKEESAEIAVKKSGTINLRGRIIISDFETGAPKRSFRQSEDQQVHKKAKPNK